MKQIDNKNLWEQTSIDGTQTLYYSYNTIIIHLDHTTKEAHLNYTKYSRTTSKHLNYLLDILPANYTKHIHNNVPYNTTTLLGGNQ